MRPSRAVIATLVAGLLITAAPVAAQEPPPAEAPVEERAGEATQMPVRVRLRPRERSPEASPNQRYTEQMVFGPLERVNASDVVDELLDELAADVAILGKAQVSPILLDRVGVSDNVNPEFARILRARIVSVLHRIAGVDVQRCFECDATTARVENAEWVVSRGIVARSDLVSLAERYKSRVVLSADLTLHRTPDALSLDVQMVRADDAAIVFAEQYRFRAEDGLLYRTADRAQSREARLRDLEDRLAERPRFAHSLSLSVIQVPSPDHPRGDIIGSQLTYRLLEAFGMEREWRYGLSGSWILNPTRLVALVPAAVFGRRVTPDSLYFPRCYVMATAGYFVTLEVPQGVGSARGAPLLGLVGECTVVHRLSVTAQLASVHAFQLTDGGYTVGGFVPSAGVSLQW